MCGAVLLFAGCEQTNPEQEPDPTPEPQEEVFAIEFSAEANEYGNFSITAEEGNESFYLYVSDMTQWETTEEEEQARFLEELAGENASAYLVEVEEFPYSTSIGQILIGSPMLLPMPLTSGNTYVVMVAPVENPTAEDVVCRTYTHVGVAPVEYTLGETAANVTFGTPVATSTSVSVEITPAEGSSFFLAWMTEYDWTDNPTDENKLAYVINSSYGDPYTEMYDNPYEYLSPGTKYYLVVFVFDSNNVGKIVTLETETLGMTFNESIKMNVEVVSTGIQNAVVSISATGGDIASFSYFVAESYEYRDAAQIEEALATGTEFSAVPVSAAEFTENNQYPVEFYTPFDIYTLYVVGFDADGRPTRAANAVINTSEAFKYVEAAAGPTVTSVDYTLTLMDENYMFIPFEDLKWSALSELESFESFVQVDNDENGNPMSYYPKSGAYKLNIDWGNIPHDKIWISHSGVFEYEGGLPEVERAATQAIVKAAMSVENENAVHGCINMELCKVNAEYNEEGTVQTLTSVEAMTIYVAYGDAEGNVYTYFEVDLNDYLKK